MFKKLMKRINESTLDAKGKVSHTKISSFVILASILVSSLVFLGIDIANAIVAWKDGNSYSIPASHITIFGMILGHHLFLLGIKKASENRLKKYETQSEVAKMGYVDTTTPGEEEEPNM